jgi:hypothetical protein
MSDKSLWQKYKENLGDTRPWDIVTQREDFVEESISTSRLDICKACPELIKLTSQCKKCGCLMTLKTKLTNAACPIGKW